MPRIRHDDFEKAFRSFEADYRHKVPVFEKYGYKVSEVETFIPWLKEEFRKELERRERMKNCTW